MRPSTPADFRTLTLLALAFATTPLVAQTPVLRWAFDRGNGLPSASTWISGGALEIDGPGGGYAVFQPTGGVGPAPSGVLNGAANLYGDGVQAARISSVNSPLIADADLAQFVLTMWIKPTAAPVDQPYARLFVLSSTEDEKSKPGLFVSLFQSNLQVGLNGYTSDLILPPDSITEGKWTFIALVYDGFSSNPYYSPEMLAKIKSDANLAVFVGSQDSAAQLGAKAGVNTGAPTYSVTSGPLELNGLSVAVGASTPNRSRAFRGLIDDVRIYSGLLSAAQIEAIRASATTGH